MTGKSAQTRTQILWQDRARRAVLPPLLAVAGVAWLLLLLCLIGGTDAALFPWPAAGQPAFTLDELSRHAAGWSVTMVAIMLPTALPVIDGYIAFLGKSNHPPPAVLRTVSFAGGYLSVWILFSILAGLCHAALYDHGLLVPPAARAAGAEFSGALLLAAGLYQWTPVKELCLRKCRSPMTFFMTEWLDGRGGAYVMGVMNGVYCVGCTALLVALLFVGGAAALLSIVPLALYIAAEKFLPRGETLARLAGVLAAGYGGWLLFFESGA